MSGISPEAIEDSADRKEYEKLLWDNSTLINERNIQRALTKLQPEIQELLDWYLVKTYARAPRADNELVELLEKYDYPEAKRVEIFKALNIPPYDMRDWESQDGTFKATAKFVSFEEEKVTLERVDGSKATIRYFDLRGSDQEFIERQIKVPMWRMMWLDGRIIVVRLVTGDEPGVVLDIEGKIIHRGVLKDFPPDWEDVELYLMKYVHVFGKEYFPTEAGPGTTVTETIIEIPTSELIVEVEPHEFPDKPPISRWHMFFVVNGIFILLLLIIWALWRRGG
jgi:hypothetical protein